ncbi:hypothetical protein AUQ43_19875 [Thalassospira sp. MCCC 1A01148]|uniref:Uncharacterized protein n=1 Tax=Thalassospira profundimaris TaxID=502049 RepID=A0A367V8Y1_9PROT|nr:hypothetical protein AUQ43_19875 [Thalassospira sp. MCCC 1A01148]RCK21647.1 hypothetical protein TH6_13760 [Thalassospira profundimaris]
MTAPLVLSLYLEKNRGKKQFVFENFLHFPLNPLFYNGKNNRSLAFPTTAEMTAWIAARLLQRIRENEF